MTTLEQAAKAAWTAINSHSIYTWEEIGRLEQKEWITFLDSALRYLAENPPEESIKMMALRRRYTKKGKNYVLDHAANLSAALMAIVEEK